MSNVSFNGEQQILASLKWPKTVNIFANEILHPFVAGEWKPCKQKKFQSSYMDIMSDKFRSQYGSNTISQ